MDHLPFSHLEDPDFVWVMKGDVRLYILFEKKSFRDIICAKCMTVLKLKISEQITSIEHRQTQESQSGSRTNGQNLNQKFLYI